MGRVKTNAKQKSTTPIALPHDGPIGRKMMQEEAEDAVEADARGSDRDDDDAGRDGSVALAVRIFREARGGGFVGRHERDGDDVEDGRRVGGRSKRTSSSHDGAVAAPFTGGDASDLCGRLRPSGGGGTAKTTKDQLYALQVFRGRLAQRWTQDQPRLEEEVGQGVPGPAETGGDAAVGGCDDTEAATIGLYRLLLEWSLSYLTPVPFQRAIQSNLDALREGLERSRAGPRSGSGNDEGPSRSGDVLIDAVERSVLESLWGRPQCWKDPLHSLDVAVNYRPLRHVLRRRLLRGCLEFLRRNAVVVRVVGSESEGAAGEHVAGASKRDVLKLDPEEMDVALKVATILKLLLSADPASSLPQQDDAKEETISTNEVEDTETSLMTLLKTVQDFVSILLCCSNIPTEGFNTLGILYGRLELLCCPDLAKLGDACVETVSAMDMAYSDASSLARLCMAQGFAAALDNDILTGQVPLQLARSDSSPTISPLEQCWRYNLSLGVTSTDPMVRWAAIKGLSTLAGRWRQQTKLADEGGRLKVGDTPPPNPTILEDANGDGRHQALIQETITLVFDSWENPPLRKLGMAIPGLFRTLVELLPQQEVQNLCQQVLKQPVHRKGRYLALDILLPYMPRMIMGSNSTTDFHGENSSRIVLIESLLEGIGDRGPSAGAIADLWTKILKHLWKELEDDSVRKETTGDDASFVAWASYWVPYLSSALIVPALTRRRQVAAFCIPRVVDFMREVDCLKRRVSGMFVALMRQVDSIDERLRKSSTDFLDRGYSDRILWAQLELCRYSMLLKTSDAEIQSAIADIVGLDRFRCALMHLSPSIRIVAYQTMERVISSHSGGQSLEAEAGMWMYALPYSMKANESNEYLSNLLQSLALFLDRLSQWEAGNDQNEPGDTSLLRPFAIEFLIMDLVVTRGAYPGTVASKETFSIALLDSLLAFVLRDEAFRGDSIVCRNGPSYNRNRRPTEADAMKDILFALLSKEVFSSLLGLMDSIWENTRLSAFQYLSKAVIACQMKNVGLPKGFYGGEDHMRLFMARGIYLASSPRQRESDTGARMLAFLYSTLPIKGQRESLLSRLVEVTGDRVTSMRDSLHSILSGNTKSGSEMDGSELPLAHGLVQASRLCISHEALVGKLVGVDYGATNGVLYEAMTDIYCRALQLSLSIVADIREGEEVDGVDEDGVLTIPIEPTQDSTPLNVNTGAIGANGTFSSVARNNEDEAKSRMAMQRVVIGTWLLTKETCAAIAAVVTMQGFQPKNDLLSKVGRLLLSTLTTVKHAGAAFAARDSLQQIATACLNEKKFTDSSLFPSEWSSRLLDEISLNERVRNSTLRRSTGYALGFLAVMRAEVAAKSGSPEMSKSALAKILKLSLPPKSQLSEAFALLRLGMEESTTNKMFVYAASTAACQESFVEDSRYESRCRVHALNILRMIIMDAPLTSVVSPFIGDAIISSILGYNDELWAIRNSSTMVFAAAMLRVVDADKNAANSDNTSNSAITISELFRRYPPLETFIPAVLEKCLDEMEMDGDVNSQTFPILLMLSRVQGVSNSGDVGTAIADRFVPLLVRSLGSRDHSIRDAAARSIANLSSNLTCTAFLSQCRRLIDDEPTSKKAYWNAIDGHLLAISRLNLGYVDDEDADTKSLHLGIQSRLFDITAQKTKTTFPPVCRSTTLKILLSSSNTSDEIVGVCEQIVRDAKIEPMISGSLLYATASEGLCLALQAKVWLATRQHILDEHLTRLRELLTCDLIDVRLVAVKCFKKHVYTNVDHLQERYMETGSSSHDGLLSPVTILLGVARMLLECTASELRRDETELSMGAHVPTVRRLSRCFLEVASSLRAVSISPLSSDDCEQLWSVSQKVTKKEAFLLEECEDSDGGTVLASNAVEMMALAITSVWDWNSADTNHVAWVETLLTTVSRLNNPHTSWRSRYSAALSLETCHALWRGGSAVPESLRKDAIIHILAMLQDSDPDVRTAAVRAATKFCDLNPGSTPLLPEWTLERTFPLAFGLSRGNAGGGTAPELADFLLGLIVNNCGGLLESVRGIISEYDHSCCSNSSDDTYDTRALVNVNTARKIFEVEVPNPYQETMLVNQLAARSLWTAAATVASSSTAGRDSLASTSILARRLVDSCVGVLRLLVERGSAGGIVHEITRSPAVFPALHGMLSATYVCMSSAAGGGGDALGADELVSEVRYLAGRLVSEGQFTHPAIYRALQALIETTPGQEGTILQLLFLLKNEVTTEERDGL